MYVEVANVRYKSYANSAGVKEKDIILAINGLPVKRRYEFLDVLLCSLRDSSLNKNNEEGAWRFLVVDRACYEYHKKEGIDINEELPYVTKIIIKENINLEEICYRCIRANYSLTQVNAICQTFQIPGSIQDSAIEYYLFVHSRKFFYDSIL